MFLFQMHSNFQEALPEKTRHNSFHIKLPKIEFTTGDIESTLDELDKNGSLASSKRGVDILCFGLRNEGYASRCAVWLMRLACKPSIPFNKNHLHALALGMNNEDTAEYCCVALDYRANIDPKHFDECISYLTVGLEKEPSAGYCKQSLDFIIDRKAFERKHFPQLIDGLDHESAAQNYANVLRRYTKDKMEFSESHLNSLIAGLGKEQEALYCSFKLSLFAEFHPEVFEKEHISALISGLENEHTARYCSLALAILAYQRPEFAQMCIIGLKSPSKSGKLKEKRVPGLVRLYASDVFQKVAMSNPEFVKTNWQLFLEDFNAPYFPNILKHPILSYSFSSLTNLATEASLSLVEASIAALFANPLPPPRDSLLLELVSKLNHACKSIVAERDILQASLVSFLSNATQADATSLVFNTSKDSFALTAVLASKLGINAALELSKKFPHMSLNVAYKTAAKSAEFNNAQSFNAWVEHEFAPYYSTTYSDTLTYKFGKTSPIKGASSFFDAKPGLFDSYGDLVGLEAAVKAAVLESSSLTGLPPEFIAASLLQEGYLLTLLGTVKKGHAYYLTRWSAGMDDLGHYSYGDPNSPLYGMNEYLPKDFKQWYSGRMFNFENHRDLVLAFGALLATRCDAAKLNAEKRGIKLSKEDTYMLGYMFYNFSNPLDMLDKGIDYIRKRAMSGDSKSATVRDPKGGFDNIGRVMATYRSLKGSGVFKEEQPLPSANTNVTEKESSP